MRYRELFDAIKKTVAGSGRTTGEAAHAASAAAGAPASASAQLLADAAAFGEKLEAVKAEHADGPPWYPYGSLNNILHLDALLGERLPPLLEGLRGARVLDVGAGDGDMGLFLEHQFGARVDAIDHAPTNYNGMQGLRTLVDAFDSPMRVHDVDLDAPFTLPRERYEFAMFLGIFYHLKNPFFVLETLARYVDTCVLSTRVARFAPGGEPLTGSAYLVDAHECNNDATNFWIFTEPGLRRIANRCGWQVDAWMTVGDTVASNPVDADHDERAFCLLRSSLTPRR